MDTQFITHFINQWTRYFAGAELPIAYYYTDHPRLQETGTSQNIDRCLIGNLKRVRRGFPFVYDMHTPRLLGG